MPTMPSCVHAASLFSSTSAIHSVVSCSVSGFEMALDEKVLQVRERGAAVVPLVNEIGLMDDRDEIVAAHDGLHRRTRRSVVLAFSPQRKGLVALREELRLDVVRLRQQIERGRVAAKMPNARARTRRLRRRIDPTT